MLHGHVRRTVRSTLAGLVLLALAVLLPACDPASDDRGYTCPNVSCGPPPGPQGGPQCCPASTTCCFGWNVCCPADKPHYGADGRCWAAIPAVGLRTVCGVPAG